MEKQGVVTSDNYPPVVEAKEVKAAECCGTPCQTACGNDTLSKAAEVVAHEAPASADVTK